MHARQYGNGQGTGKETKSEVRNSKFEDDLLVAFNPPFF